MTLLIGFNFVESRDRNSIFFSESPCSYFPLAFLFFSTKRGGYSSTQARMNRANFRKSATAGWRARWTHVAGVGWGLVSDRPSSSSDNYFVTMLRVIEYLTWMRIRLRVLNAPRSNPWQCDIAVMDLANYPIRLIMRCFLYFTALTHRCRRAAAGRPRKYCNNT